MRRYHAIRSALAGALLLTSVALTGGSASAAPAAASCWGQASATFAREGKMGEHSSSFETPRLGLRNLARALYAADDIPDDSMQALGSFVAEASGYKLEACQ
jgi:hypothetical protein